PPHFALANTAPNMHNEPRRLSPSQPDNPSCPCEEGSEVMWATLALMSALSAAPDQQGSLKISNVRPTYGVFGTPRAKDELLPGDVYFISFDIEGLTVDQKDNKVQYSVAMEVYDSKDKTKPFYKNGPIDRDVVLLLGGNRLPAFAHLEI